MSIRQTVRLLLRVIGGILVCFAPGLSLANPPARTILVLEQADVRGPFYASIFSALRAAVNAASIKPVTLYVENLDLIRFNGPAYEESLQDHFNTKYREKPIRVIVAVGASAVGYAMRWRDQLWPGVPIVFAMLDEQAVARIRLPPDVTGRSMRLSLDDMVIAARSVVRDLKAVAVVGDVLEGQPVFRPFKEQIPVATRGLDVIDLSGLPMIELRKRVAALPEASAILYTSIYSDGAGTYYPPSDALALVAETANRPILIAAETFLGRGGVGGFVMMPSAIGEEAAQLALQILDGEPASDIPVGNGNAVRPIFDWRQLQRWGVDASGLPPGSEIRFREVPAWEQYRWHILGLIAVLLLQGALIVGLLLEHRRRRFAELEARQRLSEIAHMNRHATAGELSSSIAHELNQPLGAILSNTEAAELIIDSASPNMAEIREILADIKRDDQRASEIICRLRCLLKKTPILREDIDLNATIDEVFSLLSDQAAAHEVTLDRVAAPGISKVNGDPVQLQQVILNLVVNALEAVDGAGVANKRREVIGRATQCNGRIEVSISDSGPGIPRDRLKQVFEPFYTTKEHGMGMGLSIARKIVDAHGGRIWAENREGGGSEFRLSLPAARRTRSDGDVCGRAYR